ncbi:ATP-dependent RNA helicase DDX19A [Trichinella sp. T9]|nr:ATP-dependent RNA helicase DDX19A [Trichinella sp. T9]
MKGLFWIISNNFASNEKRMVKSSKRSAISAEHWLLDSGHRVAVLSGEMIMEQRAEIVKRFRKGVDRILIATSLCSN